jgi:hypothetical protein
MVRGVLRDDDRGQAGADALPPQHLLNGDVGRATDINAPNALLGMIARPGQPKSTPAVIAMAMIAASRLKLLFRVLRYLGGVLSWHRGSCVQRLRAPSPLARCSG